MAAKTSQENAKTKAAKIAEEARAAKSSKKASTPETVVEETVKVAEEKDAVIVSEEEQLSTLNNTAVGNVKEVTKETAKEFQKLSDEEDMFLRRSIHLPSRKAIREAFESEELIGDEFGEVEQEGARRALEYQVLSDSAKAKKPKRLLGRVIGVEPIYGSNDKIISYEAKVSLIMNPTDPAVREKIKEKKEERSLYNIYIPAPVFLLQRRPELFEGEDGLQNLYRVMKNKTDALIEFVVYDISPDNKRVIGSRIRAMQLKAYDYYLDPANKKISVGSKCAARITEVGVKGITVEISGAETFIPNDDISWLHINNARNEKKLKVGRAIPVIIKSVEVGEVSMNGRNTKYVAVTASGKEATKKPMELYADEYQIGGGATYPGVVTYRFPSGKYIVRIDNKVEAICYPPEFGTPRIGKDCSVYLTGTNDDGFTGTFAYFE